MSRRVANRWETAWNHAFAHKRANKFETSWGPRDAALCACETVVQASERAAACLLRESSQFEYRQQLNEAQLDSRWHLPRSHERTCKVALRVLSLLVELSDRASTTLP
mgnify:CR=1 FL=1|eukprot:scaffold46886_cov28-Tisochrysis_lutea.AAC.10